MSNEESNIPIDNNPSIPYLKSIVRPVGKLKVREFVDGEYRDRFVRKYKDNRTYAKFYLTDVLLTKILKLNESSIILLFYILTKLDYSKHKIYLTSPLYCSHTGLNRSSFYRAIKQLVDEGWIYLTTESKVYSIKLLRISKGPVDDVLRRVELEQKREYLKDHKEPPYKTREDNIKAEEQKEDDNQ
jgi:hypothetical protein